MRLDRPVSTRPGPHSAMHATPCAAMAEMVSTQRTGLAACRASASRIAGASRCRATSTLCSTGIAGAVNATLARRSARRCAAGFINELWKGADTGSSTPRFAPRALHAATARSTAPALPAMTIWFGALKLTASTTSPAPASAQAAAMPASSSPMIAAIAPTPAGTASCIACARKRTSGTASRNASAPAATSAVYSPRLCPATMSGRGPPAASHARQTATPAVSITGCVFTVRSSAPSRSEDTSAQRSSPSASDASAKVSRTAGCVAYPDIMPTDCEPWPGKTNASFMVTIG